MLPEIPVAEKIIRHDVVKYAPEFRKTVLYRSSGQRKPAAAVHEFHRLCRLRGAVLDVLRFVQKFIAEFMLLILREVPCDKGIGGYHNIVFFHFCELRGALNYGGVKSESTSSPENFTYLLTGRITAV